MIEWLMGIWERMCPHMPGTDEDIGAPGGLASLR